MESKTERPRRSRNAAATRRLILDAARTNFARRGYEASGFREIARDAGVTPALLTYYFENKENLFRIVVDDAIDLDPAMLDSITPAEFGARTANTLMAEGNEIRDETLMIILRSISSPFTTSVVDEALTKRIYGPLAEWLGGHDGLLRSKILMLIVIGTLALRTIHPDHPFGVEERLGLKNWIRQTLVAIGSGVPEMD